MEEVEDDEDDEDEEDDAVSVDGGQPPASQDLLLPSSGGGQPVFLTQSDSAKVGPPSSPRCFFADTISGVNPNRLAQDIGRFVFRIRI